MREIGEQLKEFESTHGVRILLASESGSHAWNYAVPGSDHDVKFVFIYPYKKYLSISEPKDVIESTINETQYCGWELKKFLRLALNGNPQVQGIVQSPIQYDVVNDYREIFSKWITSLFNPKKSFWHWYKIAETHYQRYIADNSFDEIEPKKYIVIFQALMNCAWIEMHQTQASFDIIELTKIFYQSSSLYDTLMQLYKKRKISSNSEHEKLQHNIRLSLNYFSDISKELGFLLLPKVDTTKLYKDADNWLSIFLHHYWGDRV